MAKNITIVQDMRGNVEAHGTGCRDITRKTKEFGVEAFEAGDFETTREVWLDYNADFLAEAGPEAAYGIRFLPCCELVVDDDRTYQP